MSRHAQLRPNRVLLRDPSSPLITLALSWLLAALVAVPTPLLGVETMGSLEGDLSVDGRGAATYQVAIDVPPGTAGMAPDLSLAYQSQAHDGVVGWGFALQGISSITRCPASRAFDGYNGAVLLDADDRFCLDGQRLILVGAGSYGEAGTQYRTAIESWVEVTAEGGCGSGPCSFSLRFPDGRRASYGSDGNSRATVPGKSEVMTYFIDGVEDPYGNRVEWRYLHDSATQEVYPEEILYTANPRVDPPLEAQRAVRFEYRQRATGTFGDRYFAGARLPTTRLLERLVTVLDGREVTTYSLDYEQTRRPGRYLLRSLQRCGHEPDGETLCFPASTFDWQLADNNLVPAGSGAAGVVRTGWCEGDEARPGNADFNGDGRADLTCYREGEVRVLVSTGDGVSSPNQNADGLLVSGWCDGGASGWSDFDADGRADLHCSLEDGTHRVLVSKGDRLESPNQNADGLLIRNWCASTETNECRTSWMNFGRTGRSDLVCDCSEGSHLVQRSDGSRVHPEGSSADGRVLSGFCVGGESQWADFNGDGRADLLCRDTGAGTLSVQISTASGMRSPNQNASGVLSTSWCRDEDQSWGFTDFNGDFLSDLFCHDPETGVHQVMLSTGTQLASPTSQADGTLVTAFCRDGQTFWSDFDGDGMVDLQCTGADGNAFVLLADGTSVVSPNGNADGRLTAPACDPAAATPQRFDLNGDGLGDIACSAQDGAQSVQLHAPNKPNLLIRVKNGLGGTAELEYAALSEGVGDWYTLGEVPDYPVARLSTPQYVVRRKVLGDGRGQSYETVYRYADARVDLDRQTFLAFRTVVQEEPAVGRRTEVEAHQDYPLAGQVKRRTLLSESGAIQARSELEYLVREVSANVDFVAPRSQVEIHYQDGQEAWRSGKEQTYDAYGNTELEADLGDLSTPEDDVFRCTHFDNDPAAWLLRFPVESKVTVSESSCTGFLERWPDTTWNAETDRRWSRTSYDEDLSPRTQSQYDDVLAVWLEDGYGYDDFGNPTELTDAAGHLWTTTYDPIYHTFPERVTTPPNAAGRPLTESFLFDPAFGTPTRQVDANGNVYETRYDALGRPYSRRGPPPEGGDASLVLTTWDYGGSASGGFFWREDHRNAWENDDPATWAFAIHYLDGLERIYQEEMRAWSTQSVLQEQRWDEAGRPSETGYPRFPEESQHWTKTFYDLLDRPIRVLRPDGVEDVTSYLSGGLQEVSRRAAGTPDERKTTLTSIPAERRQLVVMGGGGTSSTFFDRLQQTVASTNPVEASQDLVYDSLGRLRHVRSDDEGDVSYHYDDKGRLERIVDAVGTEWTFDYDALGRVLERTATTAAGTSARWRFDYDQTAYRNGAGRLTTATGPSEASAEGVVFHFAYQADGQVATQTLTIDGEQHVRTASYSPLGDLLEVEIDGAVAARYTRYADGSLERADYRPASGAPWEPRAFYTGYTALGQPLTVEHGNGTLTTYEHYPIEERLGWLRRWRVSVGETSLSDIDYGWNLVGQIDSVEEHHSGLQPQRYAYYSTGWLKSGRGPFGDFDYRYDTAGNVRFKDAVTYELQEGTNRVVSADNGLRLTYRPDGTTETLEQPGEAWRFIYGPESRLTAVELDGETVQTSLYDFQGQRLRRSDPGPGVESLYFFSDYQLTRRGGVTEATLYLLGKDGLIAETTQQLTGAEAKGETAAAAFAAARLYSHRSAAGWIGCGAAWSLGGLRLVVGGLPAACAAACVLAALALICAFFLRLVAPARRRGGFRLAARRLTACALAALALASPAAAELGPEGGYPEPGTLYFHPNPVDSVSLTTREDGAVSSRAAYEPYGQIDEARSEGPNDFRPKFTSQELDAPTELYYYGERYYHPGLGRFLQPDPEGQYASPYTYVGNDPLSAVDPDGRLALAIAVMVGIGVVGGTVGAYFGASSVAGSYNPAEWDWSSGKTWGGLVAGAVVGATSAVLGAAAWLAGPAAGIAADVALGALEGMFFAALSGEDAMGILLGGATGGVTGGLFSAVGAGAGALASRGASALRRGVGNLATEAAEGSAARGASRSAANLTEDVPSAAKASRQRVRVCRCFPADTEVATGRAEGDSTPIALLDAADPVLAADGETQPVLARFARTVHRLVEIELDGETLQATPEHPFWVLGRGWTPAGALRPTDALSNEHGEPVPVRDVREVEGSWRVYNLHVAESHVFHVGRHRVLVHNQPTECKLSELPPPKTFTSATKKQEWQDKVTDLAQTFGDRKVRYEDPPQGRRLLDLSNYAVKVGRRTARADLSSFKTKRRAPHFAHGDKTYGIKKPRVVKGVKVTWHHHPYKKQIDLVPMYLHSKLGHEGGVKHLFTG